MQPKEEYFIIFFFSLFLVLNELYCARKRLQIVRRSPSDYGNSWKYLILIQPNNIYKCVLKHRALNNVPREFLPESFVPNLTIWMPSKISPMTSMARNITVVCLFLLTKQIKSVCHSFIWRASIGAHKRAHKHTTQEPSASRKMWNYTEI